MLLCGRTFLGARSPRVIFPRIWARKDYALEVLHTLGSFLAMEPFLSRICIWCQVPLENLTACLDPNFPSSRRIDFPENNYRLRQ